MHDISYSAHEAHSNIIDIRLSIESICDALDESLEHSKRLNQSIEDMSSESSTVAAMGLSNYKVSCECLGFSSEEIRLSLEFEDSHTLLAKTAQLIKDTFIKLMNTFKVLFTQIVTSLDIVSDTLDNLIVRVESLSNDKSYSYLTEEEVSMVYRYFGTIITASHSLDTNEALGRLLLQGEASIGSPKLTAPISNVIQTLLPRANIDKLVFSADVLNKGTKPHLGINNLLNSYFYSKLPDTMQTSITADKVVVIEYYGNKCAGFISKEHKFSYTAGTVIHNTKLTTFKEPMDKMVLLNLLKMAKRFCLRLDGYKRQVDDDLNSGQKILHNFPNMDRIVDDREDNNVFNQNMTLISEFTNIVPRIANANIANYYLFIKNITHYGQMMYSKLK